MFHELEVALGKRRQGELAYGRYVDEQPSSAPVIEPEPEAETVEVGKLPSANPADGQTRAKAAQFTSLVRSKLQALVALPPAIQPAYPSSRPQLPPPEDVSEAHSNDTELEHLLLVRCP